MSKIIYRAQSNKLYQLENFGTKIMAGQWLHTIRYKGSSLKKSRAAILPIEPGCSGEIWAVSPDFYLVEKYMPIYPRPYGFITLKQYVAWKYFKDNSPSPVLNQIDDNLAGHKLYCSVCNSHLTSLYLCPECGIRYDEPEFLKPEYWRV